MAIATKSKPIQQRINVRTSQDDQRLLGLLHKRLGVDTSQIFRLAIRALAAKEGVTT
jgi:hypothetical protein